MTLSRKFNPYNGKKPFILVDIDKDDPSRGDSHGYIGLAKCVADKMGADLLCLDRITLERMYPLHKSRDQKLWALFVDKGFPDIAFSRYFSPHIKSLMAANGKGLLIQSVNETLPGELELANRGFNDVVPHHLTPDILEYEGRKFAEEYQDMPRPFIGVLLADPQTDAARRLAGNLAALRGAHEEATIFVCTCHRTNREAQHALISQLRYELKNAEDRIKVIEFDYKLTEKYFGFENSWNPYIGLINQADHLVIGGHSLSMTSEALASGRAIYATEGYYSPQLEADGHVKDIFAHASGHKLETPAIETVDLTHECADKIVEAYKRHVIPKEIPQHYGPIRKFGAKIAHYFTTTDTNYKMI